MKTRCVLWDDRHDELVFAGPLTEGDAEAELYKALREEGLERLADRYPLLEQDEDEIDDEDED